MDLDSLYKEIMDIMSFSEEMEGKLQPHVRAYVTDTRAMLYTPSDILEHPNSYSFIIDMPGVEPQDIKVRVDDGILHVSGSRKKKLVRQERERRGRFVRKFNLPNDADEEAMEACYRHGVLSVTVKKAAREEEPPKITVITIPVS
ncbi:unnamed protein product [Victoria cruziana]